MTLYSSDFSNSSGGSSVLKIQNMTADGIISDWNYLVPADASALTSNLVVTLPSSTANSIGKSLLIKKTDNSNNAICIKSNGSDTIDSSTNYIYLYNQNDCIQITSTDNGKCVTMPDNRNSTGSTASFLRVTKPTGQTTNLTSNSTILFDTVEVLQGNGISFNTSTAVFTLSPNKTYKLTACFPKINLSSGGYFYAKWYNDTTSKSIGSGSGGDATTSTSSTIPGCITTCTITTAVTTNLRCVISGTSSVTGIGDSGNIIWAEVEEISRQATIINTMDYLNVARITSDVTGMTASTTGAVGDIVFNSVMSGNIPFNITTGVATLISNKTYELSGKPAFNTYSDTANGYMAYEWVDANTNTPLIGTNQSSGVQIPNNRGANEADNSEAYLIYTPSTNQQVKLKVTKGVGTATLRASNSTTAGSTKASIKQIGSSAVSSISGNYIDASWRNYPPIIGSFSGTAPTMATICTKRARYKEVGKNLSISWDYFASSSTGSTQGTGIYTFNIPNGFTIDTTLAPIPSNITLTANINAGMDGSALGTGQATAIGYIYAVKVVPLSSTTLGLVIPYSGYVGQTYNGISQNTCAYSFTCEIPIL